jgi:8-oxo-dGTP pyrophosphatase MutT (NUDIX family)
MREFKVAQDRSWLGPGSLTPELFRARAQEVLHIEPPGKDAPGPSDDDLNPEMSKEFPLSRLRPAAVIIPVVAAVPLRVILTLRTAHLSSHAGQIAFPGGKLDPGESVLQTATREAEEEIGLEARFIEPLGYLDLYRTRTGFSVSPLVALIAPEFSIRANPHEVDDVFEVPLAFLLNEANHRTHHLSHKGKTRKYYAIPYGERYIWGATAGIIRNLHERLKRE